MFFLVIVLNYICGVFKLKFLKGSIKFILKSRISVHLCLLTFWIILHQGHLIPIPRLLVSSDFTRKNISHQHKFQKLASALLSQDDLCLVYWVMYEMLARLLLLSILSSLECLRGLFFQSYRMFWSMWSVNYLKQVIARGHATTT